VGLWQRQGRRRPELCSIHGRPSRSPAAWRPHATAGGLTLEDVLYDKCDEGFVKAREGGGGGARAGASCVASPPRPPSTGPPPPPPPPQITINRPHRRNAFTPRTVAEMAACLADARDDGRVRAVILTGAGTAAFCSGGDQAVRGPAGYVGGDGVPRLSVLDLQVQIRRLPVPVLAAVAGYAVGGGNVLQVCCDLCLAADNAVFGQTGPKVGSFDGGYGCTALARIVGQRKAREVWMLARLYSAREALEMGLVNKVVPLADLETEAVAWCRSIAANSPTALRVCKAALNAADDGAAGLQEMAGNATLLFYGSEEGGEGRAAYGERRKPDWRRFERRP